MPTGPFDPRDAAANAFGALMTAMIALTTALTECGAVDRTALSASLERQLEQLRDDGVEARLTLPLDMLIRILRDDDSPKT